MERFFRLCRLHRLLLDQHCPVPHTAIEQALSCSPATAKRVLRELRDITHDPIPYDRKRGGYRYQDPGLHDRDLPFLWFSAAELNALLVIDQHLETLQTRLLADALHPLRERVQRLLDLHGESSGEARRRIRILALAHRPQAAWFPRCTEALLQRKRLRILYDGRGGGDPTERDISPQRLSHYRDNWYLDAWCHWRQELRTFAVERIRQAEFLDEPATDIPDDELDSHYAEGYGIFAGPSKATAVLLFSADRARWVAEEQWHPRQQSRFLPDGRYELSFPYSDPTELVMDILRQGAEVEVLAPEELRDIAVRRLREALGKYVI